MFPFPSLGNDAVKTWSLGPDSPGSDSGLGQVLAGNLRPVSESVSLSLEGGEEALLRRSFVWGEIRVVST